MEANNKHSASEIVQSLKIIHLAVVFSSVAFLIISVLIVFIHGPITKLDKANIQIFLTLGLITGAILVLLSYYVHSRQLKMNTQNPFLIRMKNYKNSSLVKIMLMEAASFFVLVIYLLTSTSSMLAGSAIIIILLLLNRPTVELISTELNLTEDEISQLRE